MGLLFLGDEREDFALMIEEVAQGVEDLCLGDAQGLGDLQDRLAATVQRDDVTNRDPQAVDDRLAAADTFQPDDVRMLGLDRLSHRLASEEMD